MTRNMAKQDNAEQRREIVAQLRNRMLSMREITVALEKQGIVNPQTGKPYDLATVKRDIDYLKENWRASYEAATDDHATRQLQEIQEIKRLAWSQKDGRLALSAIEKEMKLLGTAKETDGVTFNFNIAIVAKLVQAIEARGDKASDWFEEMLQEFAFADSTRDTP